MIYLNNLSTVQSSFIM